MHFRPGWHQVRYKTCAISHNYIQFNENPTSNFLARSYQIKSNQMKSNCQNYGDNASGRNTTRTPNDKQKLKKFRQYFTSAPLAYDRFVHLNACFSFLNFSHCDQIITSFSLFLFMDVRPSLRWSLTAAKHVRSPVLLRGTLYRIISIEF